jgi:hypothetical protein
LESDVQLRDGWLVFLTNQTVKKQVGVSGEAGLEAGGDFELSERALMIPSA